MMRILSSGSLFGFLIALVVVLGSEGVAHAQQGVPSLAPTQQMIPVRETLESSQELVSAVVLTDGTTLMVELDSMQTVHLTGERVELTFLVSEAAIIQLDHAQPMGTDDQSFQAVVYFHNGDVLQGQLEMNTLAVHNLLLGDTDIDSNLIRSIRTTARANMHHLHLPQPSNYHPPAATLVPTLITPAQTQSWVPQ